MELKHNKRSTRSTQIKLSEDSEKSTVKRIREQFERKNTAGVLLPIYACVGWSNEIKEQWINSSTFTDRVKL